MGEAKRRGTFEERKAEAIGLKKESYKRRNRVNLTKVRKDSIKTTTLFDLLNIPGR